MTPLLPILVCLPETSSHLSVPRLNVQEFLFILERFSSLRKLSIEYVPPELFEALGSIDLGKMLGSSLTHFSINHARFFSVNPEKDLSFLSNFTNLRQLRVVNKTLVYTQLDNADFLAPLRQLENLQLENFNVNPGASFDFLSDIGGLETLNLPFSASNVTSLVSLNRLTTIHLYSLDKTTLECLAKLPQLTTVDISQCGPELSRDSIQLIAQLTNLRTVYIDDHMFLDEESVQLLYPFISRQEEIHIIPKQYQMPPCRSWLSPIAPRGPYTGGVGQLQETTWIVPKPVVGH